MSIVLPIYVSLARRASRSRLVPPFVEEITIEPHHPEFEDAVYDMSGTFIRSNDETASEALLLEATIAKESSWLQIPLSEHRNGGPIKDLEDLKNWISVVLGEPEFEQLDRSKTELWVIHGEKTAPDVVKLTAGLLHPPSYRRYSGADLRGMLSVTDSGGRSLMPVYLWLDYGMDGIGFLVDNFDNRNIFARKPSGWEPVFTNIADGETKSANEQRVWDGFAAYLEHRGTIVDNAKPEPNGSTTFPDWGAEIGELGQCDVEITSMMQDLIKPRLMHFDRDALQPNGDSRVTQALSNAKFGETALRDAISNAVVKKTNKFRRHATGNPCKLIIVNDFFAVMEPWFRIWDGHDYSAFTDVYLANCDVRSGEYSYHVLHPRRQPNPYLTDLLRHQG